MDTEPNNCGTEIKQGCEDNRLWWQSDAGQLYTETLGQTPYSQANDGVANASTQT